MINAFGNPKAASKIEAEIGQLILEHVKSEGHKKIHPPMPPIFNHKTESANARLAIRRFVQQHQNCTFKDIEKHLNFDRNVLEAATSSAVTSRMINARRVNRRVFYYTGGGVPNVRQ